MASPEINKIKEYLVSRRAKYIRNLRSRTIDGVLIGTIHDIDIAKKAGNGKTSLRQLNYLKKIIRSRFSVDIKFLVLRGEKYTELENKLNTTLRRHFPEYIESCFLTITESLQANVWIEVRRIPASSYKETIRNIEQATKDFLLLFEIELVSIQWEGTDKGLLSIIGLLRCIKITAPATESELLTLMEKKGFGQLPLTWIRSKLDFLRKKGLTLRRSDGYYILTTSGIENVPSSSMRSSSDVERALALGKKKW